jgi:hypothetical protein
LLDARAPVNDSLVASSDLTQFEMKTGPELDASGSAVTSTHPLAQFEMGAGTELDASAVTSTHSVLKRPAVETVPWGVAPFDTVTGSEQDGMFPPSPRRSARITGSEQGGMT